MPIPLGRATPFPRPANSSLPCRRTPSWRPSYLGRIRARISRLLGGVSWTGICSFICSNIRPAKGFVACRCRRKRKVAGCPRRRAARLPLAASDNHVWTRFPHSQAWAVAPGVIALSDGYFQPDVHRPVDLQMAAIGLAVLTVGKEPPASSPVLPPCEPGSGMFAQVVQHRRMHHAFERDPGHRAFDPRNWCQAAR